MSAARGRAIQCRTCGATHRPDVPCPPIGKWLVSGKPIEAARAKSAAEHQARLAEETS